MKTDADMIFSMKNKYEKDTKTTTEFTQILEYHNYMDPFMCF